MGDQIAEGVETEFHFVRVSTAIRSEQPIENRLPLALKAPARTSGCGSATPLDADRRGERSVACDPVQSEFGADSRTTTRTPGAIGWRD